MPEYGHITLEEREQIALLRLSGLGIRSIARVLERDAGTISRELHRNSNKDGSYRPHSAEGRYFYRRQRSRFLDRNLEVSLVPQID